MSVVRKIREAAIDGKVPLTQLLRMTKLLAAQLRENRFEDWVHRELNGYTGNHTLPEYRVLYLDSRGTFVGSFGRSMKNAPIPLEHLGSDLEKLTARYEVRQSASELEATIAGSKSSAGVLKVFWPVDVVQIVGDKIYEDFRLAEAWRVVPVSSIIGIVDTVRNRILDLVLELDDLSDEKKSPSPEDISEERIARVVTTNIFGGSNIVAAGSDFAHMQQLTLKSGNVDELLAFLRNNGVGASDLDALQEAIENDAPPTADKFGERVSRWIGMMMGKAASGAWNVGTAAAGQLLSKALLRYYGLE